MERKLRGMTRAEWDELNPDYEYPTNTGAAVNELRSRGFDANADTLDYMVRKGIVDAAPAERARNKPAWTKRRIDQAAKWMDSQEWFSPLGWFWYLHDIDPLQYRQAEFDAQMKYGNPDAVAMIMFPGSPRRVAYVPVSHVKE